MKLIISIVHSDDADLLVQVLGEKGHRCTKIGTTGGFLREGNATILIGTQASQVDEVLDVIQDTCRSRTQWVSPPPLAEAGEYYVPQPVEVQIGGATVFVLDVEHSDKF
jgi:uncharacterized protein YaaQ